MNKPGPLEFTPDEIDQLLTAASRAPSGGNAQPWLVDIKGNQLILRLNPQRLNTFIEVEHLDAIFALGSFAHNLEIAAHYLNLSFDRQVIDPPDSRHFHVIYTLIDRSTPPQVNPSASYQAIFSRETNRQLGDKGLIPEEDINHLSQITKNRQFKYFLSTVSSTSGKKCLAKILGKVDVYRTKIIKHHNRMMAEVRWSNEETISTKDGIDIKTMELPGNVASMLKLLRDHPSLTQAIPNSALEKSTHPIIENSSHLCCLHSPEKISPLLLFDAGMLFEKIWLDTTINQLALQPWSVFTFFLMSMKLLPQKEFTQSQEKQLAHLETAFKQELSIPPDNNLLVIFRLSYAKKPSSKSLRRHWQDFTTIN